MYFGQYSNYDPTKTSTYNFYGLNRTRRTSKGEFAKMENMSAHEYPCAAPRKPRGYVCHTKGEEECSVRVDCIVAPDSTNTDSISGITGVAGGGFYYNGVLKSKNFKLSPDWKWEIEQKGNMYIINGYDKANTKSILYYYNIDTDEFDEGGKVMRDLIVKSYGNYLVTPSDDDYGVDSYQCTTPDGVVIKNSDFWTTYREYTTNTDDNITTMSSTQNIFEQFFDVGDEITIENFPGTDNGGQIWKSTTNGILPQSGITAERNNTIDTDNMTTTDGVSNYSICTARIKSFAIKTVAGGRAYHYVYFDLFNKNGDVVEFKDMYTNNFYCSGVTLKKRTRVLDNITIHHGRIWGSSPSGNQIYGSSSSDLFSFSSEDITKGFAVRIPSDTAGTVTGMCEYSNNLIVFKESSITIIDGDSPTNYYSYVINGIGCIDPRSIAVTPSGVLFLSYNGFYIWSGNVPQLFSSRLDTKYVSAVSGYNDGIYYACAVRADDGKRELLTYNMQYNIWHVLDDIEVTGYFAFKGKWYMSDRTCIYECDTAKDLAETVDWSFTSVKIHNNTLDEKALTDLWIRCEMEDGAEFTVETCGEDGRFTKHLTYKGNGMEIFRCPVRMNMCSHYQYRISGHGQVVFYEIETNKIFGGRDYKNSAGERTLTETNKDNKYMEY